MEPHTQVIFQAIEADDPARLAELLDRDPALVHARHADPELHHWTTLQFAAARGRLEACRLLVQRGAEVYTNPMNTYPPVIQAAWNGHQPVVDFFLREIPDRADGTNGLGVAINLAAREGWTELVRRHIAADPLSVHQRGWIGDAPLHWPCHNGHVRIVELLLDAGANIHAVDARGMTALDHAAERGLQRISEVLRARLGRSA
jgi:cytohesin